jgi:hypothetical protein
MYNHSEVVRSTFPWFLRHISLQPDPAGGTARKIDPMTSHFQAEQVIIRGWTILFPSGSNGRFVVFCPEISH